MDNKEKAKSIATDIRHLAEWLENASEEEGFYPVSFFSEAADRIQLIQRELQFLEAMQGERITHWIRQDQMADEAPRPVEEKAVEEPAVHSLHERFLIRKFSDLTQALSLNDRIRFCKELFLNDGKRMNQALEALNAYSSFDDSLRYLRRLDGWPPEEKGAASELIELLKKHFS
ncbi:hypothetical protein [Parabacteroides sp. Marseille-P3160]|uniref:hypothetical protein n=1 Tax=Parabacteroides sp. Marseille-P3160 TaxID=1917887 RepID=UPI0009BC626A|nr:hypothetical protein [Parabacteroides sp. Marseille-P3160]